MTHSTSRRARRPPDAVITITPQGEVVDMNGGAERMFGLRREEAVRKSLADVLVGAAPRTPELAEFGAVLSEDPERLLERHLEVSSSRPDGCPFAAEITVARGGAGSSLFIVWIRDISAQRVEETDSARRFAMLGRGEEVACIGTWDWDVRTGELRWSDNLFRLFGLNPGAFTPTPEHAIERTHADDRDVVQHRTEAAVATGRMGMLEFRIVRADGAVRRLRSDVASFEEEDGVARRFLGTVQDVTERRQIAKEIAAHIAIEEVLAAWESLEHGGERLLARLGEAMEFPVGVLWIRRHDEPTAVLEARAFWSSGSTKISDVDTAARPVGDTPGQALPVEAWFARQPVVVASLADARAFVGRDAAIRAGLRCAVAVPAVSGDRAFAVLEFYSRESLRPSDTLLRSLTRIGQALGYFFARHSGELRPRDLTAREREVLQLVAQGKSTKTIARQLTLSPSTVKSHLENIYAKWGVSDRASAVAKAMRERLIQ